MLKVSRHEPIYSSIVFLLVVAAVSWPVVYVTSNPCLLRHVERYIDIDNYEPRFTSFNICIDNTTIYPQQPSRDSSLSPTSIRECCGCRAVYDHFTRSVTLQTLSEPRVDHTFHFHEITGCECIPCHENHACTQQLLHVKRKRR